MNKFNLSDSKGFGYYKLLIVIGLVALTMILFSIYLFKVSDPSMPTDAKTKSMMQSVLPAAYEFYITNNDSYTVDGISLCVHKKSEEAQSFQRILKLSTSEFGSNNYDIDDLCYAEEVGWIAVAELKDPDEMYCVDHFGRGMKIPGDGNRRSARPVNLPEGGLESLRYIDKNEGGPSPCEQLQ